MAEQGDNPVSKSGLLFDDGSLSYQRAVYLGGKFNQLPVLDTQITHPLRTVNFAAISNTAHFADMEDHYTKDEGVVGAFRQVLQDHPYLDFITAGEYTLFSKQPDALPIKFDKSSGGYVIKDGEPACTEAIHALQEMAYKNKVSLCPGTVCESSTIIDPTTKQSREILNNTAIVINARGGIAQLRRKFTGSDSPMYPKSYGLDDEVTDQFNRLFREEQTLDVRYQIKFVSFSRDRRVRYEDRIGKMYIPKLPPRELPQNFRPEVRFAHAAFWSNLDTLEPVVLTNKRDEPYSVALCICAEMDDYSYLQKSAGMQADAMVLVAQEGDNNYTEWFRESVVDKTRDINSMHQFLFFEAAKRVRALKPSAAFIASDMAGHGYAGIFPSIPIVSPEDAQVYDYFVTAKCQI